MELHKLLNLNRQFLQLYIR